MKSTIRTFARTFAILGAIGVLSLAPVGAARASDHHLAGHIVYGALHVLLGAQHYVAPSHRYRAATRHARLPRRQLRRPRHDSRAYMPARRACHTVRKIRYQPYGGRTRIGGTMCYDAYGNAYIVPGSRYVLHR